MEPADPRLGLIRRERTRRFPSYVAIRDSGIAGKGAFATIDIPKNVNVGYYVGIVRDRKAALARKANQDYYCEVFINGRRRIIDGFALRTSNWTRYINCSDSPATANLRAIDDDAGRVKFHTRRVIKAGEELCFYYGDEYAASLGLAGAKMSAPMERPS